MPRRFWLVVPLAFVAGAASLAVGGLRGIHATYSGSGDPRNVVISNQKFVDFKAPFAVPALPDALTQAPELEHLDATPLLSSETVQQLAFPLDGGGFRNVTVRGVDPIAFRVHGAKVRVVRGQAPVLGTPGLFVGAKLLDRFRGLEPGQLVPVGAERWPVVGVLEAPGTLFESEIWADRTSLDRADLGPPSRTVVTAVLHSKDVPAFAARVVKALPELSVDEEARYYEQGSFDDSFQDHARWVWTTVGLLSVLALLLGAHQLVRSGSVLHGLWAVSGAAAVGVLASLGWAGSAYVFGNDNGHYICQVHFSTRSIGVALLVALLLGPAAWLIAVVGARVRTPVFHRAAIAALFAAVWTLWLALGMDFANQYRSVSYVDGVSIMPPRLASWPTLSIERVRRLEAALPGRRMTWVRYVVGRPTGLSQDIPIMVMHGDFSWFGPDGTPPEALHQRWLGDPQGIIAGGHLAERAGWKVGDVLKIRTTLIGSKAPYAWPGAELTGNLHGSSTKFSKEVLHLHWEDVDPALGSDGGQVHFATVASAEEGFQALATRIRELFRNDSVLVMTSREFADWKVFGSASLPQIHRAASAPLLLALFSLLMCCASSARSSRLWRALPIGLGCVLGSLVPFVWFHGHDEMYGRNAFRMSTTNLLIGLLSAFVLAFLVSLIKDRSDERP